MILYFYSADEIFRLKSELEAVTTERDKYKKMVDEAGKYYTYSSFLHIHHFSQIWGLEEGMFGLSAWFSA